MATATGGGLIPTRRSPIGGVRTAATAALLLVVASALALAATLPAQAYERRRVGDLDVIVGFGQVPAFAGEANSAQIVIASRGEAVTRGVNLEVEVRHGDESVTLPLRPHFRPKVWGQPGDYRAFFVPTAPGRYVFAFTGTVGGRRFRETFASGPGAFPHVRDPRGAAFPSPSPDDSPTPAPEPTDAPAPAEVEALERRVARLSSEVDRLRGELHRSLIRAEDSRTVAYAASAVALLALGGLTVAAALSLRRRRPPPPPRTDVAGAPGAASPVSRGTRAPAR